MKKPQLEAFRAALRAGLDHEDSDRELENLMTTLWELPPYEPEPFDVVSVDAGGSARWRKFGLVASYDRQTQMVSLLLLEPSPDGKTVVSSHYNSPLGSVAPSTPEQARIYLESRK